MIIFANAKGQITHTENEPVYQGSSFRGSIYFVAPFPQGNTVNVRFTLPNGNVTGKYLMTPIGTLDGVTYDNKEMSVWVWDTANKEVTAIAGPVIASFFVSYNDGGYSEDSGVSTVAYSTSFTILPGTEPEITENAPSQSEWDTVYEKITLLISKWAALESSPLMMNFEYNPDTGLLKKTFSNSSISTEELPAVLPTDTNAIIEQNSTRIDFTQNSWTSVTSNGVTSYTINLSASSMSYSQFDKDYLVEVYEKTENNNFTKKYPSVEKTANGVKITSSVAYAGYVIFVWSGTLYTQGFDERLQEQFAEYANNSNIKMEETLGEIIEILNGVTYGQY